jgi:hypothetical protein
MILVPFESSSRSAGISERNYSQTITNGRLDVYVGKFVRPLGFAAV